jgi:type IV pilus assembly protein PilX
MAQRSLLYRFTPAPLARAQRGTVLVVALILLLVLTLLGISAMNTTSLEERMAANTQELNRAFHAAESGLSSAFADPNAFNLTTVFNANTGLLSANYENSYSAGASFSVRFVAETDPPAGSLSDTGTRAFHFETRSLAYSSATDTGAPALSEGPNAAALTLVGGAYQLGPSL